jgi:sodium/hydrogen antiporter
MPWTLAVLAGALLAYAAVSRRLAGTAITPAMVFVAVGLVAAPRETGLIPHSTGHEIRLAAEATLTLVLFSDASQVNLRLLRREDAVPIRLLGLALPLTIVLGAAVAAVVFGALSVPEAVVLSLLLAPTDAALGQAVVTAQGLPSRIRQGLNVESGLNDGICVPLLLIALAVAETNAGETGDIHALTVVVKELGFGAAGGVAAGAVGSWIAIVASRHRTIAADWLEIVPVGTAALAYGLAAPVGGSGFIAAFVGGAVFGGMHRRAKQESSHLIEQAGDVLDGATFVLFGALLLAPALSDVSWSVVAYAVCSLTVVRMLPVALAMVGMHARWQTVAFVGWFGPRGLASIVFAITVVEESNLPHLHTILAAAYVTVGISVLAHGLTAAPLADRYAAWTAAHPSGAEA